MNRATFLCLVAAAAFAACGGSSETDTTTTTTNTTTPPVGSGEETGELTASAETETETEAEPKEVAPIPEGFHSVTPGIVVADIDAAIAWYGKVFGAETLSKMPGPDGKTMHAEIKIGDSIVMVSPENPEWGTKSPKTLKGTNGSLHVYVEDVDAVAKTAKEAGAKTLMKLEDMWWGDRFTEIRDPQGHVWSIATHIEDVPDDVLAKRAQGSVAAMRKGKPFKFEKGEAASSWKPEGYFTVTPGLRIAGGPEAMQWYADALGAEVSMTVPFGKKKLLHGEIKIGDSIVALSSTFPKMAPHAKTAKKLGAAPVSLMIYTEDSDAAFATATGAGAEVAMPIDDMFWGDRYGEVKDPSGNSWGIGTHKEDLTPEQINERMMEWMKKMEEAGKAGKADEAAKKGGKADKKAGKAAKKGAE